MAIAVMTNAYVSINSVDLSDHVTAVTVDYSAEIHDSTAMGSGFRSNVAGFKNWTITVDFHQDYASSSVDATLFDLVGAAAFPIHVKPVNATISATNPDFTGNAILENYQPVTARIGELGTVSVTFRSAGTLTRDITP